MSKRQRSIISAILLVTVFMALLNQTLMITALPVMVKTLHVSLNFGQWLTTGYVLILGIVTPISASLYDKYTSRQVFVGMLLVFILGTMIGIFAQGFWTVLLARLIQASAGGIMMTFVMISMVAIYPIEQRGTVMGFTSMVVSAGPAVGPVLSGIIVNYFGWRALFYFVLPIMVILFLLGIKWLPNYSANRPVKIDWLSICSSLFGLGTLLGSISFLMTDLTLALGLMTVGIVLTTYFIRRQLKMKHPMLKIQLFKIRSFRLMTIFVMLVFGVLMGTETILPIFFENVNHYSSLVAGMILLPGAVLNGLFAPISGRMFDEYGVKRPMTIGIILLLLSTVPFMIMQPQTPIWWVSVVYATRMTGVAFMISSVTTEALRELSAEEISHGTALNNASRQTAGSLINTIMIIVASIPVNFVVGFRWSMTITTVIILILVGIMVLYFGKNASLNREK